MSRILQWISFK